MTNQINMNQFSLNMQLMQQATSSKVASKQPVESNTERVYAKEGDSKYNKDMDADQNGVVSYDEYLEYCKAHAVSSNNDSAKAVVDKTKNYDSIRILNFGKAISSYNEANIDYPTSQISSQA